MTQSIPSRGQAGLSGATPELVFIVRGKSRRQSLQSGMRFWGLSPSSPVPWQRGVCRHRGILPAQGPQIEPAEGRHGNIGEEEEKGAAGSLPMVQAVSLPPLFPVGSPALCGAAPVPGMGLWGSQPSLPTQSVVPTLRAPALPPLWMSSSLWLWRASTETSVP